MPVRSPAPDAPAMASGAASAFVDDIRRSSRRMVRELGFMRPTLAASPYPASAVHALVELGERGTMAAAEIAQLLALDKSSVSRLLRKLVDAGELREAVDGTDARVKRLSLTARGRRTLAAIEAHARRQVVEALGRMPPEAQRQAADGLAAYAGALAGEAPPSREVEIVRGWRPGALGRIAEMHGRWYAREWGLGPFFEARVAGGLAEFSARLDRPANGLWLALRGGQVVGSVAIDGEDLGDGRAHLRWFVVDDGVRGGGVGRRLLGAALASCDEAGVPETQLWTFKGLDAARRLYESSGFALVEQWTGTQWGATLTEQSFVRPHPTLPPPARARGKAS
ncbi:MAG: MarR family winged helix-turn-helix transcriptional regulator [Burkholderiaceae bacterium]